jgi:ABC-type uncharacterized transport system permease subunit
MSLSSVEAALLAASVLGYLLGLGAAIADAAARRRDGPSPVTRLRWAFLLGAFALHAALLGARDARLGPAAFTTAPAVLLYAPWCLVLVAGIIDARQGLKALPIFLVPPVVASLLLGAAALHGSGLETQTPPDRPAIWVHIIAIVVAFGAYGFAAVLAAMHLYLESQLKQKRFEHWLDLPALDRLESVSGRFLVAATSLLTLALVLGVGDHAAHGPPGPAWFLSPVILGTSAVWLAAAIVVLLRHRGLVLGRTLARSILGVFILVLGTLAIHFITQNDHAKTSVSEARKEHP